MGNRHCTTPGVDKNLSKYDARRLLATVAVRLQQRRVRISDTVLLLWRVSVVSDTVLSGDVDCESICNIG